MSDGAPTSSSYIRQRHNNGYVSSADDLEDNACSIPQPESALFPNTRTWLEVLEIVLWIVSAVFIVYFGDCDSNIIYILFYDDRIRRYSKSLKISVAEPCKRLQMYVGLSGVSLNVVYFLYISMLECGMMKSCEEWEISSTYALPLVTILALVSFCLFCIALWPIWSFLTIPLVFTLFMASTVILHNLVPRMFRQQSIDILRIN